MNYRLGISIHNVGIDYITKNNFKRVQLCHKFSGAKDITSLLKLSKKYPISISYHAPVFHQADPTVTYYLNSNSRLRKATFEILEMNIKMAQSLPTDHLIVHFTSRDVDNKIDDKTLYDLADDSMAKLNYLSETFGIPIHLEYSGYNSRFYNPKDWINLIKEYENLGLCLDVGHLYISCRTYNMDYFDELEKMLPFVKSVHIWNTRGLNDVKKYGHIPVHPSQKPIDGWIDIENTLKMILECNNDLPIVLEPDFKYMDINEAQIGIEWINRMINKFTSERITENL